MLFGCHAIDRTKDEHLRELAEMAASPDTLVFLDTNIIAYMFKLHTAARSEFFTWSDAVAAEGRLRIPAWCAGEYLARVREGQLSSYTPKSKDEDQPRKALDAMLDTASLFVDEELLAAIEFGGDRTAYLTQFRGAIDGLKKFTRAFRHQFDPEAVHEEIQQHLGDVILDSDLAGLCRRAAIEGPARIEHRLPPAFRDESKPENRLGDLIVWFEILEASLTSREQFSRVLLVTNDQKTDWVYAPRKRTEVVGGRRKAVPNDDPKLKVIDPRLISEFKRVVGHENIAIASLAFLVEGLSKRQPASVGQLAAAIQIELGTNAAATAAPETGASGASETPETADEPELEAAEHSEAALDASSQGATASQPHSAQPGAQSGRLPEEIHEEALPGTTEDAPGIAQQQLTFEEDGYRDGTYEDDAPGRINEIIHSLKSHNWYIQNPAVEEVRAIRHESFSPTSWFVLGRNLYQAACGNAQKAMNFIVNLDIQLGRFPDDVSQYILCGMVFEIYFDSEGELRRRGKSAYMDKPLSLLTRERYSSARDFIRHKLAQSNARWTYMPGEETPRVLNLVWTPSPADSATREEVVGLLQSVQLDGNELLVDDEPADDDIWGIGKRFSTIDEIVLDISSGSLIPKWAITRHVEPSAQLRQRFCTPDARRLRVTILRAE
ncbi:PIN-like domain-containing protein [Caballeronia sp. GAFFF2]|uniref:PIN-like domain-containing protein n=1 Tax=Caballeronia sp. GAFFF2 TaxID=2921741 RepID=UPI0020296245|nr:PIN-like domain-containing protein [Caballeronia sp. GAFFF2]